MLTGGLTTKTVQTSFKTKYLSTLLYKFNTEDNLLHIMVYHTVNQFKKDPVEQGVEYVQPSVGLFSLLLFAFRRGFKEGVGGESGKDQHRARPLLTAQRIAKQNHRTENGEEFARRRHNGTQQRAVRSDNGEDKMLPKSGTHAQRQQPLDRLWVALYESDEA